MNAGRDGRIFTQRRRERMKATRFLMLLLGMLPAVVFTQDLSSVVPVDPHVTIGRLENGLRYYIRRNVKPEKRAEIRLVVNAGSVLEDDDQQGLAHFVEHMAFNGTKNFPKLALTNYLESVGMRFGPDLNAYTSFDETVYMLQIPTDTLEIITKAFDILEDWAHLVSFDPDEVERERGVVIEEWRLGRGAQARMRDKQFPVLFHDSRYAERLPIGKKDILETFPRSSLVRFYHQWYRPDLMAVVVVGDVDTAMIAQLIRRHFGLIPPTENERPRPVYPVPDHRQPLFTIATDPEATITLVAVYYKHDVPPESTLADYRRMVIEALYNGMLNERLDELTKSADPPFVFGSSQNSAFVRTKEFYTLFAAAKGDDVERALRALMTEAKRVREFGFTSTELERKKASLLRGMEQAYKEREKTESRVLAAEYIRNFLTNEPIPGIEYEFALYKRFLPGITLDEVNALARTWITEGNRVVAVSAPEKPGVHVPSSDELAAVFQNVEQATVTPYVDSVTDEPLVAQPPPPGRIVSTKEIPGIGVTEWVLSNGIHVVLKPTKLKNDEILFTAFSPGGSSLVPDSDYIAAATASSLVQESGVGRFDAIALEKKLSGKIVSVSPYIGEIEEGLSGSASPNDKETLFQLIYLTIVAPRADSTAFLSYRSRMQTFVENRSAQPEAVFADSVQAIISQHHFRRRPWSDALLHEMSLRKSYRIYQDRFSDAGDFTFVFVGTFSPDSLKPLVQTYLGGLPSTGRHEQWRDIGVNPPDSMVQRTIRKGLEPKSQVRLMFTGPFEYSTAHRYELQSMISALRILLRENLREEKGGTYGVSVRASMVQYPRQEYQISIGFGCAPDRVEELTDATLSVIDSLRRFGTTAENLTKVRETQRRERETQLQENAFWLNALEQYYSNHEDPGQINRFFALVDGLTRKTIQQAAQKYFTMHRYVRIVLSPAE
jgi:zinc protease